MEQFPARKTLALTEYLRTNSIESLRSLYSIITVQSRAFPNLWLFKYSQLNSTFSVLAVRQCRGTILDADNNWSVVAYPYEKFFNYGEGLAAPLCWSQPVKVYEKTDGSLMVLYFYAGEWRVASSGIPDATGKIFIRRVKTETGEYDEGMAAEDREEDIEEDKEEDREEEEHTPNDQETENGQFITYADLFWKIWKEKSYSLPDECDQNKCFMFELASLTNRVIVVYKQERLFVHGVRNLSTLEEEEPEPYAKKYNWICSPSHDIKSIEEVIKLASSLNPIEAEGFVIRDMYFNRVKVKSPSYVQISHLSTQDKYKMNSIRLLSIIQKNEGSEFLVYFPQFKEEYLQIEQRYNLFLSRVEQLWSGVRDISDAKEFSQVVKNYPAVYLGCLYQLRKNPQTVREFYSKTGTKKLMGLIKQVEHLQNI